METNSNNDIATKAFIINLEYVLENLTSEDKAPKNFLELVRLYNDQIEKTVGQKGNYETLNYATIISYMCNYAREVYYHDFNLYKFNFFDLGSALNKGHDYWIHDVVDTVNEAYNLRVANFYGYKCADCGRISFMTHGEVEFYKEHEFDFPKRCRNCRTKRKAERENEKDMMSKGC